MSKRCNQTIVNKPIIFNSLKEKSTYICTNCGEAHCTYVSETGKKKVIDIGYYFEIGFFKEAYYYELHHCLTGGHE